MMKRKILFILLSVLLVACVKPTPNDPNGSGSGSGEQKAPEGNITGVVTDNSGKPIAGVVVSDGLVCTQTDSKGRYGLNSDLGKAKHVIVTTPSEYRAETKNGVPQFFKALETCVQENGSYKNVDFQLYKNVRNPEKYSVLMVADPQPRPQGNASDKYAYHSLDCCEDLYLDMKETAEQISKTKYVYSIVLGDIVHENMTLFDNYLAGISTTAMPVYNVLGNHDHDLDSGNIIGTMTFENKLNPLNYSFDLGKIHYIVVDDMYVPYDANGTCPKGNYYTGIAPDILTWIGNDLSYVDRDKTIMFCAHGIIGDASGIRRSIGLQETASLLNKFKKVHCWFGHGHSTKNVAEVAGYENLEFHMVHRSTGELWTNEYEATGTPRGYVIMDVDGEKITWRYHPNKYQRAQLVNADKHPEYKYRDFTLVDGIFMKDGKAIDESYQIKCYSKGSYNDNYIYANVFLWDSKWDTPMFYREGSAAGMRMTKCNDVADKGYEEVGKYYASTYSGLSDYYSASACPSLFKIYVGEGSGSGTVKVRDRFGNTYEQTVSWE